MTGHRRIWTGGRCARNQRSRSRIKLAYRSGVTVRQIESDHLTRPRVERINGIVHIYNGREVWIRGRLPGRLSCCGVDLVESARYQLPESPRFEVSRHGSE